MTYCAIDDCSWEKSFRAVANVVTKRRKRASNPAMTDVVFPPPSFRCGRMFVVVLKRNISKQEALTRAWISLFAFHVVLDRTRRWSTRCRWIDDRLRNQLIQYGWPIFEILVPHKPRRQPGGHNSIQYVPRKDHGKIIFFLSFHKDWNANLFTFL